MYIRQRKNSSGSVSVFLVDSKRVESKKYTQSIMVKSFGSSSDDNQIAKLVTQAEQYKHKLLQTRQKNMKALVLSSESDINSCVVQQIGMKELYSTIFKKFFASFNLNKANKKILEELAILRIAKPMSKLKTATEAEYFGCTPLNPNQIYRFMDKLDNKNITKLKKAIFHNTKQILGDKEQVDVLFYDLTTIYFETNNQDLLRDFGFSKDGKHQHVQIMLALIVTKYGLPVGYEVFPGNIHEGHTLIPVLKKLRSLYKVDKVSIVADSALMNRVNLEELEDNDFDYIVAARVRNMTASLTKQMLSQDGYVCYNDDISYKVVTAGPRNLVVCFSEKRARKDAYDRAKSIEKATKHIGSSVKGKLNGSLKKSYFTVSKDSKIELDEAKIAEAARLDGYYGFYTSQDSNKAEEVIAQYQGLWQVEQTFRISKHNLKIRPVFHWNPDRIKAHFAICFLALSLVRYTEVLLKQAENHVPIEQLHQMLEQVKLVKIISKGEAYNIRSDISPELTTIYRILGIPKTPAFAVTA